MSISHHLNEPAHSLVKPANPRYLSLDVWRGLACLMIVVLHSSFYARYSSLSEASREENLVGSWLLLAISRMGIGVHLFFVISGYCIAATADSTRRKQSGVGQYFKRRLRRIFPPYWVALSLTAAAAALVWACGFPNLLTDEDSPIPHPGTLTPQQWLGNLTLTETWRHHLTGDPPQLLLGPSWSLCYEEQFYVVCGLILVLAPRRFFTGVVAVTAMTLGVTVFTFFRPLPGIQGFFFDGLWLLFAAGVFVYYLLNYTTGARRRMVVALFCLLPLLLVVVRYGLLTTSSWEVKNRAFEFLVASAFSVLLLVLHRWDKHLAGSTLLRPLTFCGTMCYSLYLVHWPIAKLISHTFFDLGVTSVWGTLAVTIPVATAVSVGAAWGFHILVERYFLNQPSASVEATPAMPTPTPPVVLELRPGVVLDSLDRGR